jgi:hypothetical protein
LVTENQTLLPEISYDKINGLKVEERAGYFINENLTGTFDLGYTTKRKFKIGSTAGYQLDAANGGTISLHYYTSNHLEGGFIHQLTLGPGISRTGWQKLFYQGNPPEGEPLAKVTFKLRHGEIINNYQVSFLPQLTIKTGAARLLGPIQFQNTAEIGVVRESSEQEWRESSQSSLSSQIFYQRLDLLGLHQLIGLTANWSKYGQFSDWRWLKGGLEQRLVGFPCWQTSLGYNHYFYQSGQNPFKYQETLFRPDDEIFLLNKFDFGPIKLGFNYYFDLFTGKTSDLDYQSGLDLHCLLISLKWRSLRQELSFGLSLKTL